MNSAPVPWAWLALGGAALVGAAVLAARADSPRRNPTRRRKSGTHDARAERAYPYRAPATKAEAMAAATEYADAKERGDRARMRELDARIFELVGYWDTKGKARFPAKVAVAMHA